MDKLHLFYSREILKVIFKQIRDGDYDFDILGSKLQRCIEVWIEQGKNTVNIIYEFHDSLQFL